MLCNHWLVSQPSAYINKQLPTKGLPGIVGSDIAKLNNTWERQAACPELSSRELAGTAKCMHKQAAV